MNKMKRYAILAALLLASTVYSQPVEPIKKDPTPVVPVVVKAKVTPAAPKPGQIVTVDASAAAGNVRFDHDFAPGTFMIDGKKMVAAIPSPDKQAKCYWVRITYWKEELTEKVEFKVAGTEDPGPVDPPTDPIATALNNLTKVVSSLDMRVKALEGAKPPPIPTPVPVVGEGLRVMIVYESNQALPSAQQAVLGSKTIRDYLNAKTVPTADGLKRGWYIADKDTDFTKESKYWQDALARPRASIPWIIINNNKTSFEGPLPQNVDDTITLLKKYGG